MSKWPWDIEDLAIEYFHTEHNRSIYEITQVHTYRDYLDLKIKVDIDYYHRGPNGEDEYDRKTFAADEVLRAIALNKILN